MVKDDRPSAMMSEYGSAILLGINARRVRTRNPVEGLGRVPTQMVSPMYAGTVPPAEVERRRAKGKRARAARRLNRR